VFKVTDGTYRKLDKLAQKAAKGSHSQQEMDKFADKVLRRAQNEERCLALFEVRR
jgi:hypothetical protein